MADKNWESIYLELPEDIAVAVRMVLKDLVFTWAPVEENPGSIQDTRDGSRMVWGPCPAPGTPAHDELEVQAHETANANTRRVRFRRWKDIKAEAEARRNRGKDVSAGWSDRQFERLADKDVSPTAAEPPSSPSSSEPDRQP